MTQKKVFIRTFGCQMNEYDSAKMADVLAAAEGFEKTLDPAQAAEGLFSRPAAAAPPHPDRPASPAAGATA